MISTTDNSKKLFLLDAYALIYRSYFAFINSPRYNSKGLNTSTMLGFLNTLEQVLTVEKPSHIAVAFDLHKPTFRHDIFPEYKANRESMPEDLRLAVPYIRSIIEAYNIPIIECEGFEADDVIGTVATMAANDGFEVYMMTPDKDYTQLVSDKILIYKPKRAGNESEIWGVEQVKANFEVESPVQVIDVLGLMGDSSDNIPGCPGIGPKTAMKLISQYGSIDELYQNIEQLKGKQKENLIQFKDQVYLSRKLVVIVRDVPLEIDFEKLRYTASDIEKLLSIFNELEFRSHAAKLKPQKPQELQFEQGTLFGSMSSESVETKSEFDDRNSISHQYYLIETPEQRATLRAELSISSSFSFDTETTGVDSHTAELVCISFSMKPHEAYCVLIPSDFNEAVKVVQEFKYVFEDENIVKVGQNIKYDYLMILRYGVSIKGKLFDTLIAHYLIQPELRHNLDYLCENYLKYKKIETEDLIGKKGVSQRSMRTVDPQILKEYACEDADYTLQLKPILEKELKDNEMYSLFENVEMPLIFVLADMENTGVVIDNNALKSYAIELTQQIIKIEEEIYALAGVNFLISSPKQLGVILFEKLKIDTNAKKTKTKQYSTGEEILAQLTDKHPIVQKILDYRGLKKLLNTYVDALPLMINAKTGRIHTSYNQAVAATGRLSSNNPNLQNIPIRDENGREIRKAFIPSSPDRVYLSSDYSQIELRILASMSQDANMLDAFANNIDIHTATAVKIFKVTIEDVTPEMRRKAKTANFGIIYGISAFGLAQRLSISRTEAKEIIDGYFNGFPSIKKFMDDCIKTAQEKGFVRTMLGRKRYLNDINSANATVRGLAERNAINAPIQGTAADIIKVAMINIFKRMENEGLKSKMIMQVHDELNFDALVEELDQLKTIVKSEMESALKLNVPLTVDINSGRNWLEAH